VDVIAAALPAICASYAAFALRTWSCVSLCTDAGAVFSSFAFSSFCSAK